MTARLILSKALILGTNCPLCKVWRSFWYSDERFALSFVCVKIIRFKCWLLHRGTWMLCSTYGGGCKWRFNTVGKWWKNGCHSVDLQRMPIIVIMLTRSESTGFCDLIILVSTFMTRLNTNCASPWHIGGQPRRQYGRKAVLVGNPWLSWRNRAWHVPYQMQKKRIFLTWFEIRDQVLWTWLDNSLWINWVDGGVKTCLHVDFS